MLEGCSVTTVNLIGSEKTKNVRDLRKFESMNSTFVPVHWEQSEWPKNDRENWKIGKS